MIASLRGLRPNISKAARMLSHRGHTIMSPPGALGFEVPWFLIPGYLAPLYLVTHVAIFFRYSVPTHRLPSTQSKRIAAATW